ncbi:general secretion pathway protein D [Azoarcus olearius]|uniref:Type IV pilus biogenesis and competence protein PilQ n=2 Tax=Azoarcus sp. (strain BH72) TaxID=418699 RepID=A1K3L7_AZOSB|nr:general secretion pathway protein D [Azoarcus olearius]
MLLTGNASPTRGIHDGLSARVPKRPEISFCHLRIHPLECRVYSFAISANTPMRPQPITAVLAALLAAACAPLQAPPALGHLGTTPATAVLAPIPAPAPGALTLPPPRPAAAEETYSIVVNKVPVESLLFSLARESGLEIDLHPALQGTVTLNAVNQPLRQLLERIARQVDMRFELEGRHLTVMPDAAFHRTYRLDYVNLTRGMTGTVATSTQIATSSSALGAARTSGGNASITQIESTSANRFWESLEANLRAILELGKDADAVVSNRESGVLVVRATARQHSRIAEFIDAVQRAARRQVMIEATIVEVALGDEYQQGIDWRRLGNPNWRVAARGSGDANALTPTLSYLSDRLDVRLDLLETFGSAKILSSPRLSVLNNQTAMLKVVEEVVYFLVDASTTQYDDADREKTTATTTPQSVSVGMVMALTAQVSAGGEIILNVRPTISSISGFKDDPNPSLGSIPNRVPQIRTREIESVLRLRSGETAVLGGLIEDKVDYDTGRIPLLGSLPLLGEVFSHRDNAVRRSELVIFLRPVVVEDPALGGDYAELRQHLPDAGFFDIGHPHGTPLRVRANPGLGQP